MAGKREPNSLTTARQEPEGGNLADLQIPPGENDSGRYGVTDLGPRCEGVNLSNGQRCGRMLAVQVTRPWVLDCPRCHSRNERE